MIRVRLLQIDALIRYVEQLDGDFRTQVAAGVVAMLIGVPLLALLRAILRAIYRKFEYWIRWAVAYALAAAAVGASIYWGIPGLADLSGDEPPTSFLWRDLDDWAITVPKWIIFVELLRVAYWFVVYRRHVALEARRGNYREDDDTFTAYMMYIDAVRWEEELKFRRERRRKAFWSG